MLTALRMELGRVERLRLGIDPRAASAVTESKKLVDEMVHLVRDLALGLRPSMLDDIGLQPTLEWQARDFSRRFGLPVDLEIAGDLDRLSDQQRTCVFRVVQEALTNCVRHARAEHVAIKVNVQDEELALSVTDDGIGLEQTPRRSALGLRDWERARELGGTVSIQSASGKGSTLTLRLPISESETALARAAS